MYEISTALFMGLMGIMWRKSTKFNLLLKCTFIGLALWGGFIALQNAGYVIKG